MELDTGHSGVVWTVAFHPDGKHLLGGTNNGIQRWRLADGKEVGKQLAGNQLRAISVSKDQKWMVCGTERGPGATVWDGEMQEKLIHVERTEGVWAVDISPDSARFATGIHYAASIWSITSGKRLVGPLSQDELVIGIRFSPSGERVATACRGNSIRIFDSHAGDNLVTIRNEITYKVATPLAWSSDGEQLFATACDNKIRSFDASTGSLLAESRILQYEPDNITSIALPDNGKFIAAIATIERTSISFLDVSTLTRIVPVLEDIELPSSITTYEQIDASIAISLDSSHLAYGRGDGKIVVRHLSSVLPDLYGPFPVSICAFIVPEC